MWFVGGGAASAWESCGFPLVGMHLVLAGECLVEWLMTSDCAAPSIGSRAGRVYLHSGVSVFRVPVASIYFIESPDNWISTS